MNDQTSFSRRHFLQTSAAAIASTAALELAGAQVATQPRNQEQGGRGVLPVVIASANGVNAVQRAYELIRDGADPLDAAIAGVNLVEDDPKDNSVGLGGLPNEDGVVELDSSVMHGPTHKAGAVAALRNIRNPSKVARLVMQRTDHVLIVGEGALRFAKAHGFKEEDLLTEEARKIWLRWKESHSDQDDWLSPPEENEKHASAVRKWRKTWGTINCCAVNAAGDIGGVTTTSGLSYKIPGRVGDSPIIGAGLYVDNAFGAAGSTGRGEANLQNCSSFLVVEMMRNGMSPEEACRETLKRILEHTEPRLKFSDGAPRFELKLYAVDKKGRFGAASFWSGAEYAVCDAGGARKEKAAFLYQRDKRETE